MALVALALLLGGWLVMTERRDEVRVAGAEGSVRFRRLDPREVISVEILRSNVAIRLERTNSGWFLRSPIYYPVQSTGVERLLEMLGNLVPAIQMSVVEQLPTRPKLVVMDTMNLWIENTPDDLRKMLTKVDVLTVNDEEARQLSGEHNLVKAARAIRAMGPKILILKKGEHGALLFGENDEIFFAPALPLADVVDPTGAGDTFAGGFVGYLDSVGDYSFDSMKRGLMYAATMASFCVEAFGPERMMDLTEEAIRARRADFSQLIQVG